MATKFPFEYSECLPNRTLGRIPERLKINGRSDPEILLIVRLLSGSIYLKHSKTSYGIRQKDNYFASNLKGYSQYWDKHFPELIAENYTAQQFSVFLDSTKFKNRSFYKNILSELSYFFYYQKKFAYPSAFIFLYRALEHASYAFPLIYVSKTDDFTKTYNFLKDLMVGDKKAGELGFFKNFVKRVYKDDIISESSIDFSILLDTESEQKEIFDLLKGLCKADMIDDATVEPRVLSIKYLDVGSFLITVRNRFFHFMNGGANNIESSNIGDVDVIFSILNEKLLYWFSTVLLAVISHNVQEFEAIKSSNI